MSDSSQRKEKQISLRRTLAWAGALVAVDAFLVNQGVLAALVGLWLLFVSLPRAAFAKDRVQRRGRFLRVVILVGAVLLVFGLNWANNLVARKRAETLIAAIKTFNQENHRYPATLDELVPQFIERVPNAKYAYISASFYYISDPKITACSTWPSRRSGVRRSTLRGTDGGILIKGHRSSTAGARQQRIARE